MQRRNPARIERILEKLRIIWHINDDQRLGQLLENIWVAAKGPEFLDSWCIEDDVWEAAIDRVLLEMEKGVGDCYGRVYFRDRIWLVTKGGLYED